MLEVGESEFVLAMLSLRCLLDNYVEISSRESAIAIFFLREIGKLKFEVECYWQKRCNSGTKTVL